MLLSNANTTIQLSFGNIALTTNHLPRQNYTI